MNVYGRITGTLTGSEYINGSLSIPSAVNVDPYTGAYEFTPTTSIQTAPTASKYLTRNIVINPIPSNYGLITWNGSTLTVS